VTTTVGVNGPLANEFKSFTCGTATFDYLEDIGTFDVTNPLELRDNGNGSTAFGVNGINPPSLLSVRYHAPYLHRGQAQTLPEVFPLHGLNGLPPTNTIATQLTLQEQADLLVLLNAIDGTTDHLRSEATTSGTRSGINHPVRRAIAPRDRRCLRNVGLRSSGRRCEGHRSSRD
jgi:hypothetical protein